MGRAARWQNNDLMFPGFWQTFTALQEDIASGELPRRARLSIGLLLKGYLLGTFLALLISALAISTRIGRDLLSTLTAMFNPLPAIALLPAVAAVVRPRQREPGVCYRPFGGLAAWR
jgi:NitT/TauT family transport system permease protein